MESIKRKQKNRTPRQKAFTLVEVLIVIVIIGIMAAIYSLSVGAAQDKAQATKIVSEMKVLKSAVILFYAENGKWPVSGSGSKNDNRPTKASLVLSGNIDTSINGKYEIIVRSGDAGSVKNGSIFIKYSDADMTYGVKKALERLAPRANLWNSTSDTGEYKGKYYKADNVTSTSKSSETIHLPVCLF